MKFTLVICSECSEAVEVTSSSLTLPFVCDDCAKAEKFQDDIAPACVQSQTIPVEFPEPSHEATVENTTLLIEDLELQVSTSKEELAKANTLILDLSKQLSDAEFRENLQDEAGRELLKRLHKAEFQKEKLAKVIFSLLADRAQLKREIARISQHNETYRQSAKVYYQQCVDSNRAYNSLKGRGLWKRVFNSGV
jgi:hypothetical protein